MTLKKKSLFLLIILMLIFAGGSFVFKNKELPKRSSSSQQKPLEEKPSPKKRDLFLGQPQFVKKKKTNLATLKKQAEKQWALKNIEIVRAWEILEEKAKKTPITIAVVDTGIHLNHSCLKNNLWRNPGEIPDNGIDDDKNGFVDDIHGWNFVHNNNNIQDYHGHGTHVSGIISAQGSTAESPDCKVIGVAPYARIMTLKYFDEGAETSDNIENTIKSIKYAVENGADIVNYSGGGPGANMDEKSIIAKAGDRGVIFVSALGNEGSKIGQGFKYYPASYELSNILSVQSQNKENELIESSNRIQHNYLEDKRVQTAPGENIISTLPPKRYLQGFLGHKIFRGLSSAPRHNNDYGYMTGTSQATAVATGVVALVKSLYPSWSMEQIINQVEKTGYGTGTEKIKKATNQGKKLSAYEALVMRDQNVDLSDKRDSNPVIIPHDPKKVDSVLINPKNNRQTADAYDPSQKSAPETNQFEIFENIRRSFREKANTE